MGGLQKVTVKTKAIIMQQPHPMFNSRDPIYRDPTGAVPCGQRVHFKVSPPRSLCCCGAYLIVEQDNVPPLVYSMFWCGMNGEDKEWWECHFCPEEKGVYFYHFELKTDRGRRHLFKGIDGEAIASSFGNRWQLTVYDKDWTTPDWLAGGIIYQIFPDRFFRSPEPKQNIAADRCLREDWGEQPRWEPNSEGKITNSDYFQGDLLGIEQKLRYLKSLGVSCIYLNPIFEAHSNHRYNTADYQKIDPLLGNTKDFTRLCSTARGMGIRIILDGVFSHTGSDSVYFNRENRYESLGAYNSKASPYYSWFRFSSWPCAYESWWNFDTLPNVDEENPNYMEYINGEGGIIRRWLKKGASGWRLDVADELPDSFLDALYTAAKIQRPDSLIMGEVWEDASNKTAYGIRRRYLLGGQMDTVMNYPFRDSILGFLNGEHSSLCMEQIENIVEHYPPQCLRLLMNHIGTHDTERALTVLGGPPLNGGDRAWQSSHSLSPEQLEQGLAKLKLASLLQFTLPGVPCIYYGDEAGMEGYRDPFNRGCYPWGEENTELISWYRGLAAIRGRYSVFREGSLRNVYSHGSLMCFQRCLQQKNGSKEIIFIAVNRGDTVARLPIRLKSPKTLLGSVYRKDFRLPPLGCTVQFTTADPELISLDPGE